MSLTLSNAVNPYILAMNTQMQLEKSDANWLLIALRPSHLAIRSIAKILSIDELVQLEISSSEVSTENQTLRQAIDWAIMQLRIHNIVLVGDSDIVQEIDENSPTEFRNKSFNLVAGTRNTVLKNREAQQKFLQFVRHFETIPQVSKYIDRGDCHLTSLFYRKYDATFLRYDNASGEFLPMLGELSRVSEVL